MSLIERAARFAVNAHAGQFRKDGVTPYIEHPARVAGLVAVHPKSTEHMVAAAFLHDVLEDTHVVADTLYKAFGIKVGTLVEELTNPSKGSKAPRKVRKNMDRMHLKGVSGQAKIIKMIDLLDNLRDMDPHDRVHSKRFIKMYVTETVLLLEVIGDVDEKLKAQVMSRAVRLLGESVVEK